ncbi:transferase [Streptomyces sp. NRRL F-4489]|uniref:DUF3492 domain-containing protein n=1 Tax=Streptomyces sp. NRRL F-4489 TaxID=1609095 RepID=UPI0007489C27|nr:DUF3492 domain-containing protein [Streptomyces sp. NRRL F-4489]KUL41765.1 transferase [Streptomyces sp. NRRL F-4489]
MRIGLLTEGGYPYASGEAQGWCDRLVRDLAAHEFALYALSAEPGEESREVAELPDNAWLAGRARLWGPAPGAPGKSAGRRQRRRFAEHFGELAAACAAAPAGECAAGGPTVTDLADRFASGLYGLADLARDGAPLTALLRSEDALRPLEAACHGAGAATAVQRARVPDLVTAADVLEAQLRPLVLDWYGPGGLAAVDLCHAASAGTAALPGLLAKRFFGTPLLVTEYGVRLREHYLAGVAGSSQSAASSQAAGGPPTAFPPAASPSGAVRALLTAFRRALAGETYARADLITPGDTRARRWQERCGADPARLRTVHPGLDARPFTAVPDAAPDDSATLVWVGSIAPDKDLIGLLHAFAEVRREHPAATLRIIAGPGGGAGEAPEAAAYRAQCEVLAAQLFPDEAADDRTAGENPVSFEEIGGPTAPTRLDAYASATVLVLSNGTEGFPRSLVEAMFCGRATVSTDTGAVREVIGGTGLVVPPRNPRALADACRALLADPERRARLGAAARARALELFTDERNTAAFRGIYLELIARAPGGAAGAVGAAGRAGVTGAAGSVGGAVAGGGGRGAAGGVPRPFAWPAEARMAEAAGTPAGGPPGAVRAPSWARADRGCGQPRRTRYGAAGEPAAGQAGRG